MTTFDTPRAAQKTQARSSGAVPQEVLATEAEYQVVPGVLRTEVPADFGTKDLPRERYLSADYHRLEVERMWSKVWQMACREEDIPNVGDALNYEIVDESIIVVRTGPDQFKGYVNSCLHRGTQLIRGKSSQNSFVCPFHGWSWNLDGSMKNLPCAWDFPQLDKAKLNLPEVKVDTWDGWVFINLHPESSSLDEYLGEILPAHFREMPLKTRFKAAHVQARVPANWKATMEAFIESYHVFITHPQIVNFTGDHNTQYDVFDRHSNRMITLIAVPSPSLGDSVDEQEVVDSFAEFLQTEAPDIPEGKTARDVAGEIHKETFQQIYGVDMSKMSNTELIDAIEYALFPNFIPWAGDGFPIVYRFRPDGDNHMSCIVDVMLMGMCPEGIDPPTAEIHWLDPAPGSDSPDWTQAPELGALGPILNQDMGNLSRVQRGLRASKKDVTFSAYQESRIRHFAHILDRYLADGSEGEA
ncbi:aromatic ring-hydroxylating dioxygenase subunit alpha [Pseudonocardia eucalypti]|uniref:Aromatic ring-hydroxylating dioxygenase subunit alpha n=1 Tax=Pseudonocardia eucalypti TaxID=648755 RepID=A0ABP9PH05_9PSEU|nr:phenylpropionate dioxygenase-like ring-hydroxylating dioxygenase large terminal subunit [Pseudonocardia eucalypti]